MQRHSGKPEEVKQAWYTTQACRSGTRWKWALAEPATPRGVTCNDRSHPGYLNDLPVATPYVCARARCTGTDVTFDNKPRGKSHDQNVSACCHGSRCIARRRPGVRPDHRSIASGASGEQPRRRPPRSQAVPLRRVPAARQVRRNRSAATRSRAHNRRCNRAASTRARLTARWDLTRARRSAASSSPKACMPLVT